ncbi:hypothetical protein HERIO_2234 [Hepatospora eriocheir]|uniref:TNase-like domain-containing protein n=1 Tax=Hepatospora eriocheir TaxID=1081669 RepID=A0A1X0Q7N4_9MICR|nr:hypothetical protein HERIO_2234 [Hepatospora eriocheir]
MDATRNLKILCEKRIILVEPVGVCKYGRLLAYLYVKINEDFINLNGHLVELGLAHFYNKSFTKFGKYKEFLYLKEQTAKMNNLGVWQLESVTMPWDFRKSK